MTRRLIKAAAAAAIAAAAVLAVPVAAQASTYNPAPPASGITVTAGGTATVPFTGFAPGESVSFFLSGENAAAASLGFVKFAYQTDVPLGSRNADGAGAVTAKIVLPANATGTYILRADGATTATDPSVNITVTTEAGAARIPDTGGDSGALLGVWIGGGALVLAGAGIAVAATVRRHRDVDAAA